MRSEANHRIPLPGNVAEVAILYVLVLGFGVLGQSLGWFATLDRWTFDALTRAVAAPRHDAVVIVGIDQQSLSRFGRWPWPRDVQGRLIDRISAAGADDLIIDLVYADPGDPVADRVLAEAIARVPNVAVPLVIEAQRQGGQLIEMLPLPMIAAVADHIGHVHTEIEQDGIVRGVYFYQGIDDAVWSHLVAAAIARYGGRLPQRESGCASPGVSFQNIRCAFNYVSFIGPPGSVDQVSALDVMTRDDVMPLLRGKIVLLGVTATGVADWVTTPVSGTTRPMSGVEFNANLLNGFLTGTVRREAPEWLPLLLVAVVGSIAALWLPRARPNMMIAVTLACASMPLMFAVVAFTAGSTILPPWSATLAVALAYPLWSWRRLAHAWRFLAQELERLGSERDDLASAQRPPDLNAALSFVAHVLQCDSVLDAEDLSEQADDPASGDLRIALPGRTVRLIRDSAFSDAETAFANGAFAAFGTSPGAAASAPMERLAARIATLDTMAGEVRAARRLSEQTIEGMTSGICVADSAGRVLAVNSAFARLTDSSRAALMTRDVLDVLTAIPTALGVDWRGVIRETLIAGRPVSYEVQVPKLGQALVTCAPLPFEDEASRSSPPADVQPTQLPAAFMVSVADLGEVQAARRQRSEALAFLSHDLRSPIVSILALVRGAAGTPDEALLARIESYARRSLNTSDQFVQLSRIESQEPFERYELDLAAVIQNAIDQIFEQANDKHIDVELVEAVSTGEGLWMDGNGELLERAFVNLLTNAIKFSPPQSKVRVVVSVLDGSYQCAVIDQGRGIAAEDLERIFDPFFRAGHADSDQPHGAGLGLRFVKTVIGRHGGSVSVASDLGSGSRFTVELPRTPAP